MGIRRFAAVGFSLALLGLGAAAHTTPWTPGPDHLQIPLWPGAAPDPMPAAGTTDRVSHPTLTLYRPTGKTTGVAVVVYPGGGFWILAMDLEGTEPCDWRTATRGTLARHHRHDREIAVLMRVVPAWSRHSVCDSAFAWTFAARRA